MAFPEGSLAVGRWSAGVACALSVIALMAIAIGVSPPRAEGYVGVTFCPLTTGLVSIPAGSRCVDGRRIRHRYIMVQNHAVGGGNGEFCVGAKQNSDGTGGNTKGFGCSIASVSTYTFSGAQAAPGSPLGYATVINNTGATEYFSGYMEYYP